MVTLKKDGASTRQDAGDIVVQKEAHEGWVWAVGHSIVTGLGPGTILAPLLIKQHDLAGAVLVALQAALFTLAGQCLLSRLFGRFGGLSVEDIFDAAAAEPIYPDVKKEQSRAERKLLAYLGKTVDIILLLTFAAVSLSYLMALAGQAVSQENPGRVGHARLICLLAMLTITMIVLAVVKRRWVDKMRPWTPYLTFFFCTLPTLLLIVSTISLWWGSEDVPWIRENVSKLGRMQWGALATSSLPNGVGLALFMLSNYPHVGHIRSRCPQNHLSIFIVPMALVVFPCFLVFCVGGWMIFDATRVPFGVDILTSTPHSWPLFTTMRYIFGVDRLVAVIYLVDAAASLLQAVLLRSTTSSGAGILGLRLMVCAVVGGMAILCSHAFVSVLTWTGLMLIGPLFLIVPAGISLLLRGEKRKHQLSSLCVITAVLVLIVGALLHAVLPN